MLSPLETVMAIFSLIIVVIFTMVGITIASKYKKTKERVYVLVGLTWIGIIEAWIPSGIVLIGYFFTSSQVLHPQLYFFIAIVGYPVTTMIWMTGFTEIVYKEKQRLFQIFFGIVGILYEILFLSVLFIDYRLIGEFQNVVDVAYNPIVSIYILISLCQILITGIIIAIYTIKTGIPANKIRGYFLFVAFVTLFIGGLVDAAVTLGLLEAVLVRLFVISSAIEFYFGFMLPDYIKKIFKVKS